MAHVTWEQYSSLSGKIDESDFERAEAAAEREVCSVIGPIRWAQISVETFGYEQLQMCICSVIDRMADDEKSGKGKGLSSVSNDGYSESYAVQTKEQLQNELKASIRTCLSGTGLVGAY